MELASIENIVSDLIQSENFPLATAIRARRGPRSQTNENEQC